MAPCRGRAGRRGWRPVSGTHCACQSQARSVLGCLKHAPCKHSHRPASTVTGQQAQSQASKHSHRPASTVTGQQAQSQAGKQAAVGKGCASGKGFRCFWQRVCFKCVRARPFFRARACRLRGQRQTRETRHATRSTRQQAPRQQAPRDTPHATSGTAPHMSRMPCVAACRAWPVSKLVQAPSPTLSPTDPVPRGLRTLCPEEYSCGARGRVEKAPPPPAVQVGECSCGACRASLPARLAV